MSDKQGKDKKRKDDHDANDNAKGKKGKKGKAKSSQSNARTSVATHPRARTAVRRAKGWGGLAGFAVAAYASYGAHLPLVEALRNALAAGIIAYVLAWACAVAICRQLVRAELESVAERFRQAREAAETSSPDAADAPRTS